MPRLRSCWPPRVEEIFLYSPRKFSIIEVNMLYISIMFGASEHIEVVSICLLVLLAIWYIQSTLFSKLRRVPGPILARFTAFYRASLIWSGTGPAQCYELHLRYGPVIRTGPRHVMVSDAAAVSNIFDNRTKFLKVTCQRTASIPYAHANRVNFTIRSLPCTRESPWIQLSPREIQFATRS